MCEEQIVPNEFFPTMVPCQGITEALESRLQKGMPTTAVCTMTLELGIDIGKVNGYPSYASAFCFQFAPAYGAFWATRLPVSTQNANYRK
jgi:hypothetical protein